MLSKKLEKALNDQLNMELSSSYLYQSMAAYFESVSLSGMAAWMGVQAKEEHDHGMKIYHYIIQRNARVKLGAIGAPQSEWKSALDVFKAALKHEQEVTKSINKLIEMAQAEKDHATEAMLQWFVTEQVEEEATADNIIQQLQMVKDAPSGLFMMDKQLGGRTAAPAQA